MLAPEREPNRFRGEVSATIDGQKRILCLTLGALAELESAYGSAGLSGLCRRLADGRFSAADLIRIIGAGLRGGGNVASNDDVATMSVDGGVPEMARIAAHLITSAFGADDPAPDPAVQSASSNPMAPQAE